MRRINPIEWTSGCSHCPAAEAGASSRAAANCIPQTLGAAEDPCPLARRLPAQPSIPKGTAMVTLRQFSSTCLLASTRAVTTAGIVTERDGNTRSPSSRSPTLSPLIAVPMNYAPRAEHSVLSHAVDSVKPSSRHYAGDRKISVEEFLLWVSVDALSRPVHRYLRARRWFAHGEALASDLAPD